MILDRLRNETKAAHQQLEKIVVLQIKKIRSKEDYIRLLELFYGYFKPVEELIAKYLDDNIVPQFSDRRNAGKLVHDIEAVGGTASLKTSTNLPSINNAHEALGAMYVLEGSTMGGKVISKMLIQALQLPDDSAVSFFKSYGADADRMWGEFIKTLNSYTDAQAQDQIATAANNTFEKFKEWAEELTLTAHNE